MSDTDDTGQPDDEASLATLTAMGRLDPPPEGFFEAGRAIWSWRTIDAELAELAYDSDDDTAGELVGVRGAGDLRQLAFEGEGLSLRVEVTPGPPMRLMGQLTPPSGALVSVRTFEGTTTVEADEYGRFQVVDVQPGPVSLQCAPVGSPDQVVATAWVVL